MLCGVGCVNSGLLVIMAATLDLGTFSVKRRVVGSFKDLPSVEDSTLMRG